MKDTVVIIGSHKRTRNLFDFKRTDCDVWMFNEAMSRGNYPQDDKDLQEFQKNRRADAVFQMHIPAVWQNPLNTNDPQHYDWLKTQDAIDVYMQADYPEVKRCVVYPLEEIVARFGRRFFSSSPEYAIALALYQGYKFIEIYGIEMETGTEYAYQRVGMGYWIGRAEGLGVMVDAHMTLFDAPLYGYDAKIAISYDEMCQRLESHKPHDAELTAQYSAAVHMVQRVLKGVEEGDNSEAIIEECGKMNGIGLNLGATQGAIQTDRKYIHKAETMMKTAGEFFFSRQEFETQIGALQKELKAAESALASSAGQMEILHQQLSHAAKGSPKREHIFKQYKKKLEEYIANQNRYAVLFGGMQENVYFYKLLDPFFKASGQKKGEAVMMQQMKEAGVMA